jgi:hypothetical protein
VNYNVRITVPDEDWVLHYVKGALNAGFDIDIVVVRDDPGGPGDELILPDPEPIYDLQHYNKPKVDP